MLQLRTTAIAAFALLVMALTSAGTAGAVPATFDSRDGACTGAEGVTVVVDLNPSDDSDPTADVLMRCVFGTPASGLDALTRSGIVNQTSNAFGDPFVCQIGGLPATCDPFGNGFWSYWHQDGTDWTAYGVGAGDARPAPGDVEGWRWVANWATDASVAPRVASSAVSITSSPTGAIPSGQNATIGFTITDATTTALCRVDLGAWTPCTTATTHVVTAPAPGAHTVTVRALDFRGNASLASTTFAVTPAPASVVSSSATVDGSHAATVTTRVAAGGSTQQVHVEFTESTDAAATRSAPQQVTSGASTTLTFALRSLAADTTFRYRVVTVGAAGDVASSWATFTTAAAATTSSHASVSSTSSFVGRGGSVQLVVDGLVPGESLAVRMRSRQVAVAAADSTGNARVTVRIASRAPLGRSALIVTGSQSGRTGRTIVTVTRAQQLRVAVSKRRARAGQLIVVTTSRLLPGEAVIVRRDGRIVADGTADRRGEFTTWVGVGTRTGRVQLRVTGSHANRQGSSVVRVVRTARGR